MHAKIVHMFKMQNIIGMCENTEFIRQAIPAANHSHHKPPLKTQSIVS